MNFFNQTVPIRYGNEGKKFPTQIRKNGYHTPPPLRLREEKSQHKRSSSSSLSACVDLPYVSQAYAMITFLPIGPNTFHVLRIVRWLTGRNESQWLDIGVSGSVEREITCCHSNKRQAPIYTLVYITCILNIEYYQINVFDNDFGGIWIQKKGSSLKRKERKRGKKKTKPIFLSSFSCNRRPRNISVKHLMTRSCLLASNDHLTTRSPTFFRCEPHEQSQGMD